MPARHSKPHRQITALRGFRAGWPGRVAVFLAGLSLFLQALLPWPAAAAPRTNAELPRWVMASLCLAHDTESQAPAQRPARRDPAFPISSCAVCLGLHCAGTFVPPVPAALRPPGSVRTIERAAWTEAATGGSERTASRARAPPVTV
jgi:hypothetical protein